MYALYTILALVAAVMVFAPVAVARSLTRRTPLRLRDRLGYGGSPAGSGPRGWIHAVSVGEAITATAIVEGLHRAHPTLPLVVSTVTETGARVVRERFGGVAAHRFFPLDLPGAVRRAVGSIDPAFLVCMETELWPNLLRALRSRGVPVMIANGRISDRSFRRYRFVRPFLRRVLADVTAFAMRSDEDARRIIALGARPERVFVTGNLKHDAADDPAGAADVWRRLLGLVPGRRVWIAGSTHRGEEEAVLAAHGAARAVCDDLVLVIAPRHPERVSEVLDLVAARGWTAVCRSQLPRQQSADGIIVLDTVGELAQIYGIADIVFVGGSLIPAGGHNMLEPALRRKPVLFGPHTQNFREAAALLESGGGALVVRDGAELGSELRRLLVDPELCAKLGAAAWEAIASRRGAVTETLELVERFLRPGPRSAGP